MTRLTSTFTGRWRIGPEVILAAAAQPDEIAPTYVCLTQQRSRRYYSGRS